MRGGDSAVGHHHVRRNRPLRQRYLVDHQKDISGNPRSDIHHSDCFTGFDHHQRSDVYTYSMGRQKGRLPRSDGLGGRLAERCVRHLRRTHRHPLLPDGVSDRGCGRGGGHRRLHLPGRRPDLPGRNEPDGGPGLRRVLHQRGQSPHRSTGRSLESRFIKNTTIRFEMLCRCGDRRRPEPDAHRSPLDRRARPQDDRSLLPHGQALHGACESEQGETIKRGSSK